MKRTFDTPGPTTIRVRIPAGRILVEADTSDRTEVDVEPDQGPDVPRVQAGPDGAGWLVEIDAEGKRFWQRHSYRVHIRCPQGTALDVKTASADLETRGGLGSVEVRTASGDVRVEVARGPVRIDTASGAVGLGEAAVSSEVKTVSGDISLARASGRIQMTTASGRVAIGGSDGDVQVHSISGDQGIDAVGGGSVWMESISGDVEIGVLPGVDLWLDLQSLSGLALSDLPATDGPRAEAGPLVEIRLKSLSGDLRVHRTVERVFDAS